MGEEFSARARPRAIGCEGAGGCVIASQARQEKFSMHMLDHLPLAGYQLQRLGHVFADFAQPAVATAGAEAAGNG